MTRLHFAVSTDMVTWDGARPVCGNDFRHVKILTNDWREVTCKRCQELCGFDEQLTVCERVPYTPIRFKTLDDGREQVAA